MATEATAEQPVDVSGTDATLTQELSTDPDSQDGGSGATASLNGPAPQDGIENKQITDIVESSGNSAEVSVSGSDTEASTNKANKSGDDKGNGRASSAPKKPQSFKAVSVNKTFLGSKVTANAASRPESAASSATVTPTGTPGISASKLKLVAKNSSNLGGSTKTLTTNGKSGAAPDPSTVWNRNRPIPPPDTKKMSDEELMSKYGIHMASRLRPEDESGGQSNWADIDEDDDSWATPETITWTDGTKSSLAATEEPPVRIPSPIKEFARPEKPKSPAPSMAPPPSTNPPPVAKASPSIKPGLLASGKGLILKGAPEKPTLVAKSTPRSSEVKSPWATLPPVAKAPPVMELPQHSHAMGRTYPPRDETVTKNMTPPPTKEIAADDFSRSPWKDGGGNRELYNSQSGRYEPVHDRRGSRAETIRQQPSLLHRSPHHETQGPAEPSAAFQTSRTTGQDAPPYGRRRGSSNVSGGSGSFANRFGRPADALSPSDMIHHHPPAPAPGPASGPYAPGNVPHGQRTHPSPSWQTRPSPVPSHAAPVPVPPAAETAPQPVLVDDVELQKKLMRERRELAIKRRQEEEAREEAAKQERIRLKLEAMGPAPERKSAKKEELKEGTVSIQPRQGSSASHQTDAAPNDSNPPANETARPSPMKQAAPDRKGSIQVNGIQQTSGHQHEREHGPSNRLSGSQASGTWPENTQTNDRLPSWTGASQAAKNVWGAPGNDRTLGNGTFDADLNHLADSQPTQPASLANRQAPIGPPRPAPSAPQSRVDAAPTKLAPIGPPQPRTGHGQSQGPAGRSVSQNPWINANIEEDDRTIRRQANQRMEEQMRDLANRGITLDDAQPPVKDTWRPVALGEDGKRLTGTAVTKIHGDTAPRASWSGSTPYHDATSNDYRQHPGPNSMRQPPIGSAGPIAPGPISQPRAGSRFFPNSGPRDRDDYAVQSRSKSPTPPPPTMHGHPAYDGDAARPHVSLPPARPVVKLPPVSRASAIVPVPTPIAPPKPASFAAALAVGTGPQRHPSSSAAAQTHRPVQFGTQENWQDKINNLIGRKPSSAARPTVVDSSSKSAFDAHGHYSATVSLPNASSASSNIPEESAVTSKGMAEDCFDEQEMGSLPPVHLPKQAPDALWNPVDPNWQPQPPRFRVEATVADNPRYVYEYVNSKPMIRFKTPGMEEAKFVPAPFSSRTKSNPRRQALRGARSSRGGTRGGRDVAGDHSTSTPSDRLERPERHDRSSNRSRGGFRPRSENWTRHSSAAQTA
ncbi:hypothetical protein PG991_005679 [Apiospora marii]|uniref:Inner centromere protein ARK-binding domain-containing protein n=1 Tax=Apiospora marii TaxID=335849 RepID=A0ABR1SA20_9PEZI